MTSTAPWKYGIWTLAHLLLLGIAFWMGHPGLLKTFDSYRYLESACQQAPLIFWPPLYPWLLHFTHCSMQAILGFHLLLLLFFSLGVQQLVMRISTSVWSQLLYWGLIVFAVYTYEQFMFIWSELLFSTLFISLLLFYQRIFFQNTHGWKNLLLLALLNLLLCLTRHAGIFVVAGQMVGFLYFYRKKSLALILALLPAAAFFFIYLFTRPVAGDLQMPIWQPYFKDAIPQFFLFSQHLLKAFWPWALPKYLAGTLLLGIMLWFILLKNWKTKPQPSFWSIVTYIGWAYALGYLALPGIQPQEMDRFLAPALPLVWLGIFHLWEKRRNEISRAPIRKIGWALLFILLGFQIARSYKNGMQWQKRSRNQGKTENVSFFSPAKSIKFVAI